MNKHFSKLYLQSLLAIIFYNLFSINGLAKIHTLPIIIRAEVLREIANLPINNYRVFKTGADGSAVPVAFQIDEKDEYGFYILDKGLQPNQKYSNGIFDGKDELSIMGDDIGQARPPSKWPFKKPSIIYEVKFTNEAKGKSGSVYIGTYLKQAPPLSKRNYVNFQLKRGKVVTSRYQYVFNPKNYLVVSGFFINRKGKPPYHLIDSSTLFLKADLKYFLSMSINHESIESSLESYKIGPVRCIARLKFSYEFLKMNFDLGMYTEVSFFSNSIVLPATIENPLDGKESLNEGSLFYYGFSLLDNPKSLKIDTNMPEYKESEEDNNRNKSVKNRYWFTATADEYMVYVELDPSKQMMQSGNVPNFYKENTPAAQLKKRPKSANPLGRSPVNLAISLDLTTLTEGVHDVAIRLFIENKHDEQILDQYKKSHEWKAFGRRIDPSADIAYQPTKPMTEGTQTQKSPEEDQAPQGQEKPAISDAPAKQPSPPTTDLAARPLKPEYYPQNPLPTQKKIISKQAYYLGGAVGTIFGFGSGHAVQQRYWPDGFFFSKWELILAAGSLGLLKCEDDLKLPCGIGAASAATFAVVRLWDTFDVWLAPGLDIQGSNSDTKTLGQLGFSANF